MFSDPDNTPPSDPNRSDVLRRRRNLPRHAEHVGQHGAPPEADGTARNNVGVPSEGTEPRGGIGAPGASILPSHPNARGYRAPDRNIAVVQPGNPASFALVVPGYSPVMSRHLSKNSARIDFALAAEGAREAARLIRERRRLDMLDAIEAWGASHGPTRAYWASQGAYLIREWRRLYPHHWEAAA